MVSPIPGCGSHLFSVSTLDHYSHKRGQPFGTGHRSFVDCVNPDVRLINRAKRLLPLSLGHVCPILHRTLPICTLGKSLLILHRDQYLAELDRRNSRRFSHVVSIVEVLANNCSRRLLCLRPMPFRPLQKYLRLLSPSKHCWIEYSLNQLSEAASSVVPHAVTLDLCRW